MVIPREQLNLSKKYKTLKDDQIDIIEFLLAEPNRIASAQAGIGKTICSLTAAIHKMKADPDLWCAILCPVNAVLSFRNELRESFGIEATCLTSDGVVSSNSRFVIFTYSSVREQYDRQFMRLLTNHKVLGIFDEVHMLCGDIIHGWQRDLAEAKGKKPTGSEIATYVQKRRYMFSEVIGLTATPLLNDYTKLWNLFRLIRPDSVDSNKKFWEKDIFEIEEKILWKGKGKKGRVTTSITGVKDTARLKSIISQMCISRFIEYNVKWHFMCNPPTPKELANYKKVADGFAHADTKAKTSPKGDKKAEPTMSVAKRLSALQCLLDGVGEPVDAKLTKDRMLANLLYQIMQRGEGAVVFADYNDVCDRYTEFLKFYQKRIGINNIYTIRASSSLETRGMQAKAVQNGDVILISRAGTASINGLEKVNNFIFLDVPFRVVDMVQAVGRVCRISGKHEQQNIYILGIENTVDAYKLSLMQAHTNTMVSLFDSAEMLKKFAKEIDLKQKQYMKNKLLWKKC